MSEIDMTSPEALLFTGIIFIFGYIVQIFFWVFIVKTILNAIRRSLNHNFFKNNVVSNVTNVTSDDTSKKNRYIDVNKSKLEIFNTDNIDSLKDYFYTIFLEFEEAYNNLDYNVMKTHSTKQLFHNYYTGISLDLKIGQKKIINNIERKKVIIYEIDSTIAKQTVSTMIEISYITYTINSSGNIISGKRNQAITERFEVTFRKDFLKDDVVKCPNCGANVVGNKCEYCRTTLKNQDFSISSIKKII